MAIVDIEKHLEDAMVISLRAIYLQDTWLKYDTNEALSKIHISTSKPIIEEIDKPSIFVDGITYRLSEVGLANGFVGDIIDTGNKVGESFGYRVAFSLSVICAASKSPLCKNLSNDVVNKIWVVGKKVFESNFSIRLSDISKSGISNTQISPNNQVYFTQISISGEAILQANKLDINNPIPDHILAKIRMDWLDESNVKRGESYL